MHKINIISATIYLGTALLISGTFILASLGGTYTAVEKIGGAIWVFILSTIILMPIVIPIVKRKILK
jgi:hypothetical protein